MWIFYEYGRAVKHLEESNMKNENKNTKTYENTTKNDTQNTKTNKGGSNNCR